jgi:hypothetical protein
VTCTNESTIHQSLSLIFRGYEAIIVSTIIRPASRQTGFEYENGNTATYLSMNERQFRRSRNWFKIWLFNNHKSWWTARRQSCSWILEFFDVGTLLSLGRHGKVASGAEGRCSLAIVMTLIDWKAVYEFALCGQMKLSIWPTSLKPFLGMWYDICTI